MADESGAVGTDVRRGEGAEGFPHSSKYPFFVGLGLFLSGVGLAMWLPVLVVGIPVLAYGIWGWTHEYAVEEYERGIVPEQKRQLLGVKSGYLAMVLVVGGELLIFAGLFVAWFYLRAERGQFFPPEAGLPTPQLALGGLMTLLMLAGSVAMVRARGAIQRNDRSGLTTGVGAALVLGLVFLAVLGFEWAGLFANGFDWTSGPYGAAYFALTGVHAAHLIVGLGLLALLSWRARVRKHFSADRHLMVSTSELYWHFLTFVSILILAFVYFPLTVR